MKRLREPFIPELRNFPVEMIRPASIILQEVCSHLPEENPHVYAFYLAACGQAPVYVWSLMSGTEVHVERLMRMREYPPENIHKGVLMEELRMRLDTFPSMLRGVLTQLCEQYDRVVVPTMLDLYWTAITCARKGKLDDVIGLVLMGMKAECTDDRQLNMEDIRLVD